MDERVETLAAVLDKTERFLRGIDPDEHGLPTPCADYDVGALLEHLAVWIQVFDAAVNDTTVGFDPSTHRVGAAWADVFGDAARSIVRGLREHGFARPMTMTSSPLPGEFVLHMLSMEYVGHGWDLARARGVAFPFTDHEVANALDAARAIIAPQYRGSGMFDAEVAVPDDAPLVDRAMGFLGRDPAWGQSRP